MKNAELAQIYKTIGDSFLKLSSIYSSSNNTEGTLSATKEEKPIKVDKPALAEETAIEEKSEPVTYTKEDVRSKLAQKAKADSGKYKGDVKGIVAKFSSDGTLTGVPTDKYSELVAELEVVGNA